MYNVENILRNYSFIFIDIKFVLDTLWTFVLTFLKYIIQIDAFSLRCDKKRRRILENYQIQIFLCIEKIIRRRPSLMRLCFHI